MPCFQGAHSLLAISTPITFKKQKNKDEMQAKRLYF